jgi:hypothetical protein
VEYWSPSAAAAAQPQSQRRIYPRVQIILAALFAVIGAPPLAALFANICIVLCVRERDLRRARISQRDQYAIAQNVSHNSSNEMHQME